MIAVFLANSVHYTQIMVYEYRGMFSFFLCVFKKFKHLQIQIRKFFSNATIVLPTPPLFFCPLCEWNCLCIFCYRYLAVPVVCIAKSCCCCRGTIACSRRYRKWNSVLCFLPPLPANSFIRMMWMGTRLACQEHRCLTTFHNVTLLY